MMISPARKAAFEVLLRIETERAFSSVMLPLVERELSIADRGLCHELVLGSLRRQIYLDRAIDSFSDGKMIDIEVRIALRLALYQIYFLDKIPQYSAINESVNLAAAHGKRSAKGFVNAISRRATREKVELRFIDDIDRISVETSHPRWLIEKWIGCFGIDQAENAARANNEVSENAFRVLKDLSDLGRQVVDSARRSGYVEGCHIISGSGQYLNQLAEQGEIYIQDEASQMVAHAVAKEIQRKFLDVCAAPGGKTGLVTRLNNASHTAGDLHRSRVELLRDNLHRQNATSVNVVQFDAEASLPFAEGEFDTILVDAPCSGTGTIRRNPEIRYNLAPEDLKALNAKQLAILTNASKLVKPGGSIVYSTCSIEAEENEAVCALFLEDQSNFAKIDPDVPSIFLTADGFARTWPERDAMDGFFIAAFRRLDG